MAIQKRWYWFLACEYGDSLWVEAPTPTPPMDLLKVRCPYHDTPMRPFVPVDVKK